MNSEKIYLVAGGDMRFLRLSGLLSEKGRVYLLGFDEKEEIPKDVIFLKSLSELKEQPDYIVLPMRKPLAKQKSRQKFYGRACGE